MHPDIEPLSRDVANLAEAFTSLGEKLKGVGDRLQGGGEPPSEELIADQVKLVQEFRGLRARTAAIATSLPLEPPTTDEQVTRLTDLSNLVACILDLESKRASSNEFRLRSISLLEKIDSLKYSLGVSFKPLHDCQRVASELRRQIEQADPERLPEDAAKLAGGDHPFVDLLDLTENQRTLDDDAFVRKGGVGPRSVWRVLEAGRAPGQDRSGEEPRPYRRRARSRTAGTPPATQAYAYHPLTVGLCEEERERVPEAGPQFDVSEPNAASGVAIDETKFGSTDLAPVSDVSEHAGERRHESGMRSQLEKEASQVETHPGLDQATDEPEAEKGLRQSTDGEELSALGSKAVTGSTPHQACERNKAVGRTRELDERDGQPDMVGRDATGPDLAASALRSGPPYQPRVLRDVVCGLVRDRRFGLAYHLSRACLEADAPHFQQRVPSELVLAVCLGHQVRYEAGEIASMLTEDFAAIADGSVRTDDPSWDYAIHILRAASALRPRITLAARRTPFCGVLHLAPPAGPGHPCSLIAKTMRSLW